MPIIPGLHSNILSKARSLQKCFEVTSKGETLILKKKSTKICFDKKIANNGGKGFLLTTKFYKSANYAAILSPEKRKPEGKLAVHPEGTDVKKQENEKTKTNHDAENHINKLHTKLGRLV